MEEKMGRNHVHHVLFAIQAIVCIMALALLTIGSLSAQAGRAQAATSMWLAKGTMTSTPAAGPTGAIIAVSGSGWQGVADGTVVNFGYSASSSCAANAYIPASTEQAAVVSGGAFSGWFLWPTKTPTGLYTVCASIGSTLAAAGSYTVLSAAPARLTISSSTFTVGQQAVVSGSNFLPPQTSVTLALQQLSGGSRISLGTATSDANGAFSQTYTIPANPTGPVELIASAGSGSPPTLSASVSFIVYAAPATPTPSPAPSPSPTPGRTATPAPGQTATPASIPTQSTQPTSTPATPISQGTQLQTPTPTDSAQTTQQPAGQTPATGSQQSKKTLALVAGAAFVLLAAALAILLWRRKTRKRASTYHPAPPQAASHMPARNAGFAREAQSMQAASGSGPQWGDFPLQQASPSPPVTQLTTDNYMATGNSMPMQRTDEAPAIASAQGTAASSDLLQDPLLAAIMQQARSGLFVLPGKKP
jgi:hypothetical protein